MQWELVTKKVKDLKPHPKNPRKLSKHDYEHLSLSLERFGLIDKPIINLDGTIIGGHQRVAVLNKEKVKTVDCWQPKKALTQEEVDELNIRLNRNHGEFDWDILANEWDLDQLLNAGFTGEELGGGDIETIESADEDEGVMEPTKNPITKKGDLIELGAHRLVCGDSTTPDDVTKLLGEAEPVLMVTDPPYGVNYDASWRKDIKGKQGKAARAIGKVQNDDKVNWALAWALFPGAVAYVWHAGKYCAEVQKSLEEADYEMVTQIIWVKQHFALSRGDYHWQHEPCWYAVKKGCNHNWQGSRKEATIWEISNLNAFGMNKDDERTEHSTQKPLECMAKPIRNNTTAGDGVYDPFAGSGTTLIAADKLDRIAFCMELDPAYCDLIVKRYIRHKIKLGQMPMVKRNGKPCNDYTKIENEEKSSEFVQSA